MESDQHRRPPQKTINRESNHGSTRTMQSGNTRSGHRRHYRNHSYSTHHGSNRLHLRPIIRPKRIIRRSLPVNCVECGKAAAGYKCPRCPKKYCSLDCCKSHKERCVPRPKVSVDTSLPESATTKPTETPVKRKYTYEFPTEDTVPLNKLLEIKDDERIRELLKSQDLRRLITTLDDMYNPALSFRSIMDNPEFRAFSNIVLEIVGLQDDYNL